MQDIKPSTFKTNPFAKSYREKNEGKNRTRALDKAKLKGDVPKVLRRK